MNPTVARSFWMTLPIMSAVQQRRMSDASKNADMPHVLLKMQHTYMYISAYIMHGQLATTASYVQTWQLLCIIIEAGSVLSTHYYLHCHT